MIKLTSLQNRLYIVTAEDPGQNREMNAVKTLKIDSDSNWQYENNNNNSNTVAYEPSKDSNNSAFGRGCGRTTITTITTTTKTMKRENSIYIGESCKL